MNFLSLASTFTLSFLSKTQMYIIHIWPYILAINIKSIYYVGFFLLIWFFNYVTQENSSVCVALYYLWLVCK